MNHRIFVTTFLLLLSGCSSNGDLPESKNVQVKTTAVNTGANLGGTSRDSAAVNTNGSPVTTVDQTNAIRGKKSELQSSTVAAVPAPDDSTFTTKMDNDGNFVEVRQFKKDPILDRAERKVIGKTSKYFVYLKNGKVVEAPADAMSAMQTMSPSSILNAIGMRPPQSTPTGGAVKNPKEQ